MPCRRGGSFLMKSYHSCDAMPPKLMAVYALSCAICTLKRGAPSILRKALSVPSSSQIAMHICFPISWALASAALIIRSAASMVIYNHLMFQCQYMRSHCSLRCCECEARMVLGFVLCGNELDVSILINIGCKEFALVGFVHEHIHDSPSSGIDSACFSCALDTHVIPFLKVGSVCSCLHGFVGLSQIACCVQWP